MVCRINQLLCPDPTEYCSALASGSVTTVQGVTAFFNLAMSWSSGLLSCEFKNFNCSFLLLQSILNQFKSATSMGWCVGPVAHPLSRVTLRTHMPGTSPINPARVFIIFLTFKSLTWCIGNFIKISYDCMLIGAVIWYRADIQRWLNIGTPSQHYWQRNYIFHLHSSRLICLTWRW